MLVLVAAAHAQDFTGAASPTVNAQSFRATVQPLHTLWVDEVGSEDDPKVHADALFHYTNDPLVYRYDDGEVVHLVSDVLEGDLLVGGGTGPVRLGLDLPIYLYSVGSEQRSGGLGDLGLDGRVVALDHARSPIGLGFGGRLYLPSTTVTNALGNGEVAYELTASVDGLAGPMLLALNLGTHGGPQADLENLVLDDGFLIRAAGIYEIDDATGAGIETHAELPYSASLGAPGATDWEWLATGYRRLADWQLRLGAGTGLTHGIGSPDFRVLLGLGWHLPTAEAPTPAPAPAPAVTDTDSDGLLDPQDGCPSDPEDADGFQDEDGCPDPDNDADGIADGSDTCPLDPEDADGVKDTDGCPDPEVKVALRVVDATGTPIDTARAMVNGGDVHAPGNSVMSLDLLPGGYSIDATAVGFVPTHQEFTVGDAAVSLDVTLAPAAKPLIVVTRERIDLKESIQFETGSAKLKSSSFAVLGQVAQVLRDYPEIRKLRIDGHTDSRGSDAFNLKLSTDRAAAVRQWLVDAGIAADRLESQGFGESKPLDPRETPDAWAKNRRVEMTIEDWQEQPPSP